MTTDWNTDLYLRFEQERTRPVRDLLAQVTIIDPQEIVDLGCGPGNSTSILRQRWPEARIVGIDTSAAMLEEARKTDPETEWLCQDIAAWRSANGVDLICANASLQWVPDHQSLVPSLLRQLTPGGTLAFQVPALYDQPGTAAIREVAALEQWKHCSPKSIPGAHPPRVYHDYLANEAKDIDLWETIYYHRVPDHSAIIDWYRSTGLRPYLDALRSEADRQEFQRQLLEEFRSRFPVQADGTVLLPFRRLFVVAARAS
jgi:trans-aconitate 2-methyltransferase